MIGFNNTVEILDLAIFSVEGALTLNLQFTDGMRIGTSFIGVDDIGLSQSLKGRRALAIARST